MFSVTRESFAMLLVIVFQVIELAMNSPLHISDQTIMFLNFDFPTHLILLLETSSKLYTVDPFLRLVHDGRTNSNLKLVHNETLMFLCVVF